MGETYRVYGLVEKEEEYLWSSCGESYGIRKGPLDLEIFWAMQSFGRIGNPTILVRLCKSQTADISKLIKDGGLINLSNWKIKIDKKWNSNF